MSAPAMTPASARVETVAERPPRRAQLARYALWQLRDYGVTRGLPTVLIAGMFGWLAIAPLLKSLAWSIERMPPRALEQAVAEHGSIEALRQSLRHELSGNFLGSFIGTVVFLGAIFAMHGLVSNDRKSGHYRFLFSKPLSPLRYYGQAFLVHWAGFVAAVTLLALVYGAYVEPVLTPTLLLVVALVYLMYAGIGFFMTTIVRWDWLGLAGLVLAAQLLWDRFGASSSVFAKLLYLLPPMHRTGEVYKALAAGTAVPWQPLVWIAAYGAALVVAGLVMLRTQRLAIP